MNPKIGHNWRGANLFEIGGGAGGGVEVREGKQQMGELIWVGGRLIILHQLFLV